jgi:hypothetical protein
LYLDVLAQFNPRRNDDILADIAFLAYFSLRHDMAEVPDLCFRSDGTTFVNYRCGMGKIIKLLFLLWFYPKRIVFQRLLGGGQYP